MTKQEQGGQGASERREGGGPWAEQEGNRVVIVRREEREAEQEGNRVVIVRIEGGEAGQDGKAG